MSYHGNERLNKVARETFLASLQGLTKEEHQAKRQQWKESLLVSQAKRKGEMHKRKIAKLMRQEATKTRQEAKKTHQRTRQMERGKRQDLPRISELFALSKSNRLSKAERAILREEKRDARIERNERLLTAASNGDYKQTQLILKEEEGVDVNFQDSNDWNNTPLHKACFCSKEGGNYLQVVALLLANGAIVHSRDIDGETPLHIACRYGRNVNIVKLLIDSGSDVGIQFCGRTALQCASESGHADVVKFLIEADVDINIQCNYGHTALHRAITFERADVIKLLIYANANLDIQTLFGETALHIASRHGDTCTVMLLLRNGASMNLKTSDDQTAEDLALEYDNVEIVEFFQNFREIRRESFSWLKRRRQGQTRSV